MKVPVSWLVVGVIAVCAAAAGLWTAQRLDRAPQLAGGTWLPRPRSVGSFVLTDQNGAAFTQTQLRGAPSLVFFGFTHCPDVCPTTLYKLAQARRAAAVPHLRVLFVTLDPARDTPPLLARYLRAFDPQFLGLTGSEQTIAALAAHFGVAFARVALPGGDYTIDHSAVVFLLDAAGNIVAVFTAPLDIATLTQDLRHTSELLRASS